MKTRLTFLLVMLLAGAGSAVASDTSSNDKLLQAAMNNAETYASPLTPQWGLALLKTTTAVNFKKLFLATPTKSQFRTRSDLSLQLAVQDAFPAMHRKNANIEPNGLFLSAKISF